MRSMNENGPDDLPPIEIAPPELEYTIDNVGYEAPNPRGFVWMPIRHELSAICDNDNVSDDSLIFVPDGNRGIRGKEIIPNLIKQMEAVRQQILKRKPGNSNELSIHESVSDANVVNDPWEIKFVVETGEIGDSGDIFKQYKHIASGRVVVARLTPAGKLFLPKIPEEWGQLIVEPGAQTAL